MRTVARINDNAVSPVIGVMLMIVVTIIIAAVVSAFAGGLVGEQKKVPVAQFDMRLYSSFQDEAVSSGGQSFSVGGTTYPVYGGVPQFMVIMKSGEPLPTKDLKLVTYRDDVNGTLQKYEYTYAGSAEQGLYWDLPWHTSEDAWGESGSIIHPGEVYRTNSLTALNNVLGSGAATQLSAGDSFEVNIVHIPTNTIIYHQVVTVQ